MRIEKTLPEASLRSYFVEYYFIQLDAEGTEKRVPIIDDCSYDFVFYKETMASLHYGRPSRSLDIQSHLFTVHNLSPPYTINFHDQLSFFTVKLQPWLNAKFFSNLKGKGVIDLGAQSPFEDQFYQRVFDFDLPSDMFEYADEQLRSQNFEIDGSIELVKAMCELIRTEKGIISVNELSERFERSRQYLSKIFKQQVMYTLKKYITTVRILDLVKFKAQEETLPLTALAYQYGYFDQAHFIHDFKQVCGVTPKYFFTHLPEFLLRH